MAVVQPSPKIIQNNKLSETSGKANATQLV